jgi:hypothetical protein
MQRRLGFMEGCVCVCVSVHVRMALSVCAQFPGHLPTSLLSACVCVWQSLSLSLSERLDLAQGSDVPSKSPTPPPPSSSLVISCLTHAPPRTPNLPPIKRKLNDSLCLPPISSCKNIKYKRKRSGSNFEHFYNAFLLPVQTE